jgi:hypothetical protein
MSLALVSWTPAVVALSRYAVECGQVATIFVGELTMAAGLELYPFPAVPAALVMVYLYSSTFAEVVPSLPLVVWVEAVN